LDSSNQQRDMTDRPSGSWAHPGSTLLFGNDRKNDSVANQGDICPEEAEPPYDRCLLAVIRESGRDPTGAGPCMSTGPEVRALSEAVSLDHMRGFPSST